MKYIADLHIHSRHSMACAKNLDLEHIYQSAKVKGITLVSTGDFTHPAWFAGIKEKLVPEEEGLFSLKPEIARKIDEDIPETCKGKVRFILQTEISNIYRKQTLIPAPGSGGNTPDTRVRKNHNLIYLPGLEDAEAFNRKLDKIGNIRSDGRPILGLDARNLLEILLETREEGFLIPAHIWTPWFSLLGSKSGFDRVSDCFEDLTPHIFALETGLSSDAPMNRQVSGLDPFTLVSSSDAHSPMNLGRNANLFDAELSYSGLKNALVSGDESSCRGTIDLYPQEGKYHYDGHRACGVRLHPAETEKYGGICPECKKPLTIGVLNRVYALSDRKPGEKDSPHTYIIPLKEILSELCQVGVKTKKVDLAYRKLIQTYGPEMEILLFTPLDDLQNAEFPLLQEAIARMREQKVHISPGYDGEYGEITLFTKEELNRQKGQKTLFAPGFGEEKRSGKGPGKTGKPAPSSPKKSTGKKSPSADTPSHVQKEDRGLNPEQQRAATAEEKAVLITAGPGAGKTRTLTRRIAWLIREKGVAPEKIAAITFTRRAKKELEERLGILLGHDLQMPFAGTFHGLGLALYEMITGTCPRIVDEEERIEIIKDALKHAGNFSGEKEKKAAPSPVRILACISRAKRELADTEKVLEQMDHFIVPVWKKYQALLEKEGALDTDDILKTTVSMISGDPVLEKEYGSLFRHILVDEFQDVNPVQFALIKLLYAGKNQVFAIGDKDQAIYGFQGADIRFFSRFAEDFPEAFEISLTKNYRSTKTIVDAAFHVIRKTADFSDEKRVYSDITGHHTLTVIPSASSRAEAVMIGKTIEDMVGGVGMQSVDMGKTGRGDHVFSFSDIAVFFRTHSQGKEIEEVLSAHGIPCRLQNRDRITGEGFFRFLASLFHCFLGQDMELDRKRISANLGIPLSRKRHEKNREILFEELSLKKDAPVHEIVHQLTGLPQVQKAFSPEKKEELVQEILEAGEEHGKDIQGFLTRFSLLGDQDRYNKAHEKVALMTLHAAKGLEFPVVFISGCEDGFLPFKKGEEKWEDPEEERRLFYVGLTRAKERLFLTYATKRKLYGKTILRKPSPFVEDIEKKLLSRIDPPRAKQKKNQQQLTIFCDEED